MSRQVRYGRLRYLYYMATAKVWVFDTKAAGFFCCAARGPIIFRHGTERRSKNWHWIWKMYSWWVRATLIPTKNILRKTFIHGFFLISQNPFSSETFRRAFDFHREMLEYGYPRNDILFRENTTGNPKF